jgi:hypothetical protein
VWGVVNGCRAFLPSCVWSTGPHRQSVEHGQDSSACPERVCAHQGQCGVSARRSATAGHPTSAYAVFPGITRTSGGGGQSAVGRTRPLDSRRSPCDHPPPWRSASPRSNRTGAAVVGPDAHLVSLWSRRPRPGLIGRLTAPCDSRRHRRVRTLGPVVPPSHDDEA